MSGSPLKKFILTPAIISASIFATLTLPLAVLGNKPVTIKLHQDSVFYGQLRDVATPYLGLASAISLGAGVASVAVAGWQQSKRKSEEIEAQLSGLAQHLEEKEAQLQALKLSESRLESSGLKAFLDEEVPLDSTEPTTISSSSPIKLPEVEELVITPPALEPQVVVSPAVVTVQEKAAKFACAQTFLGYARSRATEKPTTNVAELTQTEVEQLHAQLQQIMAQMASVQKALSATSQLANEENVPVSVVPLQVVKSWSVHERAS